MSTSLLYHGWRVRGYDHVATRYEKGEIIFVIEHKPNSLRCPNCGGNDLIMRGKIPRRFVAPSIGRKPVGIELAVQRVECRDCGVVRRVRLGFADPYRFYIRAFERLAIELSRKMTIKDVAEHLMVSWDVIKGIVKRNLNRRLAKPKLHKLKRIAID